MKKYKMHICYDGTNYVGWQIQPNGLSIQEVIQNTISKILNEQVQVIGSGRTDAGVHAENQVCHFSSNKTFHIEKLLFSVNRLLPKDISIIQLAKAPHDFHSRYSAKQKIYHYHLYLGATLSPFKRTTCLQIPYLVDISVMESCSKVLLGTHDFKAFANQAHLLKGNESTKNLYEINFLNQGNDHYIIEFIGSGFLYKMVRNIVGALIECGRGKLSKEALRSILSSKDRKKAPSAVAAHGLFLHNVIY